MIKKQHYTAKELNDFAHQDVLNDAIHAEEQAENGPYYPDKGITKESLLEFAKECREELKIKNLHMKLAGMPSICVGQQRFE